MGQRLDLQTILEALLGSGNVYFQPPPGYLMTYPCIVYRLNNMYSIHANNEPYKHDNRYMVTVIDENPDSVFPSLFAELPRTAFDRSFSSDNLNHYVFNILY